MENFCLVLIPGVVALGSGNLYRAIDSLVQVGHKQQSAFPLDLIDHHVKGKDVDMEHAVIVHFNYGQTDLGPIFTLEERLDAEIAARAVGEYDGNEIAADGSDGFLYMYGPDADRLFEAVRPILESEPALKDMVATLRYGPPEEGVKEVQIAITPK